MEICFSSCHFLSYARSLKVRDSTSCVNGLMSIEFLRNWIKFVKMWWVVTRCCWADKIRDTSFSSHGQQENCCPLILFLIFQHFYPSKPSAWTTFLSIYSYQTRFAKHQTSRKSLFLETRHLIWYSVHKIIIRNMPLQHTNYFFFIEYFLFFRVF